MYLAVFASLPQHQAFYLKCHENTTMAWRGKLYRRAFGKATLYTEAENASRFSSRNRLMLVHAAQRTARSASQPP